MNRVLGTFAVLLAFALSCLAQDTTVRGDKVPVPGQDAAANFSACQHAWAGCDRAKLTPPESTEMVRIDHQRNISNCREGLQPCDRTKLSDAERTALAVADHENNVSACNNGVLPATNHN